MLTEQQLVDFDNLLATFEESLYDKIRAEFTEADENALELRVDNARDALTDWARSLGRP